MKPEVDHFVLFVGDANTEGALSRLKVKSIRYEKKLLNSKPKNWHVIARMIQDERVRAVAMKIVPSDVARFGSRDYLLPGNEILDALALKPNVVFAYEGLIDGSSYRVKGPYDHHFMPSERDCLDLFSRLNERNIAVSPYKNLAELSVVAGAFIEDYDQNLLFRAYVPAERIYSAEIDQVMDTFRDWLSTAIGVSVRRDGYTTRTGSVYEFFGDGTVQRADVPDLFAQFSTFLDLCRSDPEGAASALEVKGLTRAVASEMAERYGRRGRRISIDVKQEYERIVLQVAHSLESEVLDAVDGVISMPRSSSEVVAAALPSESIASVMNVNLQQNIVAGPGSTVQGILLGNSYLSDEAKELLEVIYNFASELSEDEAALSTAVHELEDPDAPHEARLRGKQRLKGFLYRVAGHGEKAGVALLQKYLESKFLT